LADNIFKLILNLWIVSNILTQRNAILFYEEKIGLESFS